ncbi:DUF424 domain-containing protein [Nanoarchaeota archaeon]
MIVKKHKHENKLILSVCDNDLIDKKFEEGNLQLDLTQDFYKGEEANEDDVVKLVEIAQCAHVIGEKSVSLLVSKGIVKEEHVKKVSGIPHVEIFKV